jgi:hypothetical protein
LAAPASEPTKGLPELSSGAWLAFLVASLLALALGVYPLIGYPAIMRRFAGDAAGIALFCRPSVVGAVAAGTVVLLVLAFTGRREGVVRSRLAYAACALAVLGMLLLVAALKSLVLRAA